MKSLKDQVAAYMALRSERDGKPFKSKDMAEAVARLQPGDGVKCQRQHIEHLLKSDSVATPRYMTYLAAAMGTTVEVLSSGRYAPPGESDQQESHVVPMPPKSGGLVRDQLLALHDRLKPTQRAALLALALDFEEELSAPPDARRGKNGSA